MSQNTLSMKSKQYTVTELVDDNNILRSEFWIASDTGKQFRFGAPSEKKWDENGRLIYEEWTNEKEEWHRSDGNPARIMYDYDDNTICEWYHLNGYMDRTERDCVYNDGTINMLNNIPLEEALCRSEDEILICSDFVFTPLIAACQEGFKEVVKQLLEEGSDISVKNHEGKTALSYAQEARHTEIVDMLLAAEANKKT